MNTIWSWLDGKKRNLALIYWSIVIPSIVIVWPEGAPEAVHKASAILGVIFTATGFGHAGFKQGKMKGIDDARK